MIWKRLFGGGSKQPVADLESESNGDLDGADLQLEAAIDWLDDSTLALRHRGIGEFANWNADLAEGRIVFTNDDGPPLNFACQAVGTFNDEKQTWHWGWDHPSIPSQVAAASEAVRDFGIKYGLNAFTTRQIEANEADAWQFVALAGMLTNAVGAYRCPGAATVYVTLYEID